MSASQFDPEEIRTSRRQALKGIAGAGAVLWSVPTLQVITMTAAHADSPSVPSSPPAQPPSDVTPPRGAPSVGGTEANRSAPTVAGTQATGATLPATGASETTMIAGLAGTAAVGLGAAIVHSTRSKPSEPESDS